MKTTACETEVDDRDSYRTTSKRRPLAFFPLTLERRRGGGGVKWTPIGFSELKFEAFKQSK